MSRWKDMSGNRGLANTPVPERIDRLPRDKRGYPIPVIVKPDKNGDFDFRVLRTPVVKVCAEQKRCGMCGEPMVNPYWFIGPPGCFKESGMLSPDVPMHEECARYSLSVCPYLTLASYIAKPLSDASMALHTGTIKNNDEVGLPPEYFNLGYAHDYRVYIFEKIVWVMPVNPVLVTCYSHGKEVVNLTHRERTD